MQQYCAVIGNVFIWEFYISFILVSGCTNGWPLDRWLYLTDCAHELMPIRPEKQNSRDQERERKGQSWIYLLKIIARKYTYRFSKQHSSTACIEILIWVNWESGGSWPGSKMEYEWNESNMNEHRLIICSEIYAKVLFFSRLNSPHPDWMSLFYRGCWGNYVPSTVRCSFRNVQWIVRLLTFLLFIDKVNTHSC